MTTTAVHRVYNFSAGPAVMPLPVLEEHIKAFVAKQKSEAAKA